MQIIVKSSSRTGSRGYHQCLSIAQGIDFEMCPQCRHEAFIEHYNFRWAFLRDRTSGPQEYCFFYKQLQAPPEVSVDFCDISGTSFGITIMFLSSNIAEIRRVCVYSLRNMPEFIATVFGAYLAYRPYPQDMDFNIDRPYLDKYIEKCISNYSTLIEAIRTSDSCYSKIYEKKIKPGHILIGEIYPGIHLNKKTSSFILDYSFTDQKHLSRSIITGKVMPKKFK